MSAGQASFVIALFVGLLTAARAVAQKIMTIRHAMISHQRIQTMTTFPDEPMHCWGRDNTGGLTKREFFAAMAMQTLLHHCTIEVAAIESVDAADALIAVLNAEPKP